MKSKVLFALSAIGLLGLASCEMGTSQNSSVTPEPPVTSSSKEELPPPPPAPTRYKIVDSIDDHVSVVGLPGDAIEGEKVSFTIAVAPGYEFLDQVLVKSGETVIDVTLSETGVYSFVMPAGDVTISAADQVSSFALNYQISPELGLKAYARKKNSELIKAECRAVAGVYDGVYSGGEDADEAYRYIFDAMGNVTVENHYCTPSKDYEFGDTRFAGHGVYEVTADASNPDVYHITFSLTKFSGYPGYLEKMDGELTITFAEQQPATPAAEGAPATAKVPTLEGKLIELRSSYPYTTTWRTPVTNHEFKRAKEVVVDENAFTYVPYESLPSCAAYLDKVYYKVQKSDYFAEDAFTANGKQLLVNEDGYYVCDVPYHTVNISLTEKTRLSPVTLESDNAAVKVSAYTREKKLDAAGNPEKDPEGNDIYVYTPVTEVAYQTEIYLKVTEPEDKSVGVSFISVVYGSGSAQKTDSGVNPGAFKTNADGYISAGRYLKMEDMDFGLKVSVTTVSSWLDATDAKIKTGKATKLDSTGSILGFDSNNKGQVVTTDSADKKTNYYYKAEDVKDGGALVELHKLSDSDKTQAYKAWVKNGLFVVNTTGRKDVSDFIVAGADVDTAAGTHAVEFAYRGSDFAVLTGTVGGAPINAAIGDFDPATGVDQATGVDHDELTVKWDVTLHNFSSALPSDSVWASEGVFDVLDGQTLLATVSRHGHVLTDFTKGLNGTFNGEAGALVTDGVGKVTFNGVAPYLIANGETVAGKGRISLILKDEATSALTLYVLELDDAAKTYSRVSGYAFGAQLAGQYIGGRLNYDGYSKAFSLSSYFKCGFGKEKSNATTASPNKSYWESSTHDYTLNGDGTLTIGTKTIRASEDGKVLYVVDGNATYLLSSTITNYNSSAFDLKTGYLGGGDYLAELVASKPTDGTDSGVVGVYHVEGNKSTLSHFTTVTVAPGSAAKWHENGAKVSYVKADGTVSATCDVVDGVLLAVVDGTYVVNGKNYVVAGLKVTVDGVEYDATRDGNAFTYTVRSVGADGAISESTVTLTIVDVEAKTATITEGTPVVVGESHAGYTLLLKSQFRQHFKTTAPGVYESDTYHKSSSQAELRIEVTTAGTLTFDWETSTESGWDYMDVLIGEARTSDEGWGDTNKDPHSGEKTGTYTRAVQAGDVITIIYKKDSSGDRGLDKVVVKNISIA